MRLVRQTTEQLKKEKDTEGNVNQKEYNDEMENLNDFKTTAFKKLQKAIFVP